MLRIILSKILYNYRRRALSRNNLIDGTVLIGKGTQLFRTSWGKYSGCNSNCSIYYTKIGNYVNIASGVTIAPRSHIYTNFTSHDIIYNSNEQCFDFGNQCEIGNDVWICTNAIILPGVVIGDGAIIAAGAVVTKSVLPYAIVAGNPARIVRMRFNPKTVSALQDTCWWKLDPNELFTRRAELEAIVGFDLDHFKSSVVFAKKHYMKKVVE